MQTEYVTHSVRGILEMFAQSLQPPDGKKIIHVDHYYDADKGMVIYAVTLEDLMGEPPLSEDSETP